MIYNHEAPALSELDMLTLSYVPEGGNWKDIPESVPSKRLEQIRASYAAGKGSRSTYYGRLNRDMPAYTISTNFNRPGCGCNTHYEQDRTLTYREAARIQSFPDDFEFLGSKASIAKQIGNAVPPLLGFQIANSMSIKGMFVDLFAGAGGLALGFVWSGWKPIIANDIEESFLQTHQRNIDGEVICGNISNQDVIGRIVEAVTSARRVHPDLPVFVLGGPPCQGFSTANYRTIADARNWLFLDYCKVLEAIKPDGFVFENVTGILNFEKGSFFERILEHLGKQVDSLCVNKVNCANYGIPQRRERVIVFGSSEELVESFVLSPVTRIDVRTKSVSKITNKGVSEDYPLVTNVEQAISDLPSVEAGCSAESMPYRHEPQNDYQRFVRGVSSPQEYCEQIQSVTS